MSEDGTTKTIAVTIPADWHFFRGHFDDMPILAGVVQLNEIVLRELRGCWPEHRRLRRVIGLKFKKPIRPGDAVELELTRTPPDKVAFELRLQSGVASSGVLEFLSELSELSELPSEPGS
jgi:3-hydroxymyristoyl/3-hydroxydecanoyl-(acyl carrier protein) dehydratase